MVRQVLERPQALLRRDIEKNHYNREPKSAVVRMLPD